MPVKQEYQVKLSLFEGPLDLLLYLVNRSEVDITKIQVSVIAQQYLEYLDVMRELNINVAAEYLYMASTLIRLKAREMLPQSEQEPLDSEDGIYNRDQLIAQLLEYKKFKEAANSLRHYEAEQIGCFSRGSVEKIEMPVTAEDDELVPGAISVFDLISAFRRVLKRADTTDEVHHIVAIDNVRIDDRIESIIGLLDHDNEVPFEDLFKDDMRRIVLVVTFMAILELIKMQEIHFRQELQFGGIFVKRRHEKDREVLPLETSETEIPKEESQASEESAS